MSVKTIRGEGLSLETRKLLAKASKGALIVNLQGKPSIVLRPIVDDDLADEFICQHPEFKASVRKARRNFAAGKGIPLAEVRRRLRA